jgi:predicted dehydrogenase
MTHKTVRIGIIGAGQIGKAHLRRYRDIPEAEIVALADINASEAQRVAAAHDIPNVYTDFREMLVRDDIAAVDVCLHNNLHRPATVAAFSAGKHVYCEKPMAGSFADAQAMMDASREYDKKLCIQINTLFKPETRAAKRLIDAGKLGKIYHARSYGHRRRNRPFVDGYGAMQFVQKAVASGGALYDMGIYHLGQLLYCMNNPRPLRVSGKIYQEIDMDKKRKKESGFDVDELGCAFIRMDNGITLDFIEAWAIHIDSFGKSFIAGNRGGISFNPFTYHTVECDMVMDGTFDLKREDYRFHKLNENEDAYDSAQKHWVAALQGRVPLEPIADVALTSMLISEGIYLSDERGEEVDAAEIRARSKSTAAEI